MNRSWCSPHRKCTRPQGSRPWQQWAHSHPHHLLQPAQGHRLNSAGLLCGPIRLPLYGFTYSWTLSSKSFSNFPHGTCLLSVSCQYLALDWVYHLLWAAFPNNPTPGTLTREMAARHPMGLSPAKGQSCSGELSCQPGCPKCGPTHYRSRRLTRARGFSAGLFPVHSPLLRESSLISLPPLTNMLKFSR